MDFFSSWGDLLIYSVLGRRDKIAGLQFAREDQHPDWHYAMHYLFCKCFQRRLLHTLVMIYILRICQVLAHALLSYNYIVLFCTHKSCVILESLMCFFRKQWLIWLCLNWQLKSPSANDGDTYTNWWTWRSLWT